MSSAVQPLRTPNDEQKLAIEHNGGFLLEAGAGSGKTFVLVEHTIFLLNKFLEDAKNKQLNEIACFLLGLVVVETCIFWYYVFKLCSSV